MELKRLVKPFGKGAHIILPKSFLDKEVTIYIKDGYISKSERYISKNDDGYISKNDRYISKDSNTKNNTENINCLDSIYYKLMRKDGDNVSVASNQTELTISDLEPFMLQDLQKLVFTPKELFKQACLDLMALYSESGKSKQAETLIREAIKRKKEFSLKNDEELIRTFRIIS